jgi:YVTN family beta-propeller protein
MFAHLCEAKPNNYTKIPVGRVPTGIVYDPHNNNIYVANSNSNSISVINGYTKKVIETISVGKFPIALTYDRNNNFIYVICRDSNDVYIIDGNNNKVISIKKLPDGGSPLSIDVNPFTKSIVITNNKSNTTLEIDSNTNSLIQNTFISNLTNYNASITDHPPEHIAINVKNNKMYVTSPETNEVLVMEGQRNTYIPDDVKLHAISIIISFIAIPILIIILWYIIAKRKKYQKKIN